jgi:signal peptidase II
MRYIRERMERTRANWTLLGWVGVIVVLDQLSKILVATQLSQLAPTAALSGLCPDPQTGGVYSIPVWGEYFRLTLTCNPGGAFGILAGQGPLLTVLTVGVAATILLALWRGDLQSPYVRAGLVAIAGGAIGNLLNRLWMGQVVDFLDIGLSPTLRWPTFNLADTAIVAGTALLLWRLLTQGARS